MKRKSENPDEKSPSTSRLLVCVAAGGFVVAAEEYDYFRNARFPGSLREDVSLDTVQQSPDVADEPGRRVVLAPEIKADKAAK